MSEVFVVGANDRAVLDSWMRSESLPQAWGLRARIILSSAEGEGMREMARRLKISPATACRWRRRYLEQGLS